MSNQWKAGQKKKQFTPVFDINSPDFGFCDPKFWVKDSVTSHPVIKPTVGQLSEAYLTGYLIREFTRSTNNYVESRKRSQPELSMWNRGSSKRVHEGEILNFIGMVQYMGLC